MKRKEIASLELGKAKVSINNVTDDDVIVTLTSNVNLLKIVMKVKRETCKNILNFMEDCKAINHEVTTNKFSAHVRCRTYCKKPGDVDFVKRYYDDPNGIIEIVAANGCFIVRIDSNDEICYSFCFDYYEVASNLSVAEKAVDRYLKNKEFRNNEMKLNEWL